uniref:F-box domain-containing protein n=1 Tax=Schizophyllum commune (strain H4-8 / FGSC 9210) TaxID=578458 RepID=D8QAP6_SCHCM
MFIFGRPPPPGPPRLAIPELLFEIFRDARLSRRDLSHAALVCRAWHAVADVVLWEDMPGLAPLLMLMPADAWTMTPSKRRVEKQTLTFRRALRASDWANVATRSCSVRRLTLFGAPPNCVQRAIIACPPPANLLPKLQTLTLTQLVARLGSGTPSPPRWPAPSSTCSSVAARAAPAPRPATCASATARPTSPGTVLDHPLAARLEDATLDVRLTDLARLPAPPTLRRLRVHALDDARRALPLLPRTLRDILPAHRALARLAHVEITGPVQLFDADVAAVARAWPALQTLVLAPHATGASCLTLGALVPLARHCPKLEFIALPLCALDVPSEGAGGHYYLGGRSVAPLGGRPVASLDAAPLVLVLWRALGRSDRNYGAHVPDYDPVLLAKFLVSLFPGIQRVSNDLAAERVAKGLAKEKVEDYWDTPVEQGIWDELERAMPMR